MATNFVCFCGRAAKTFETKNGLCFFTCGTAVDFKKMSAIYKMKASKEKDKALEEIDMGCNMKINENEISFLQKELKEKPDRCNFPKCDHGLFAKLGISASEKNNGRLFFTCNVKLPDLSCKFFQWYDEPKPAVKRKQEEEKLNHSKKLRFIR